MVSSMDISLSSLRRYNNISTFDLKIIIKIPKLGVKQSESIIVSLPTKDLGKFLTRLPIYLKGIARELRENPSKVQDELESIINDS